MLSPFALRILLHHYVSPDPHERSDLPTYQQCVKELVNQGILTEDGNTYKVTGLGHRWVLMILQTPVPEITYIDPRTKQEVCPL